MAGGKETPRQKMIGMMYLVLTALLALNVSKEVIAAFVTINDKLDASSATIHKKSDVAYEGFDKKKAGILLTKGDLTEFNKWHEKANQLKKETESIVGFILSECNEMIKTAEGEDWIEEKNEDGKITKLKPLMQIKNMDNYDIPTNFFVGTNPEKPKKRGLDLREKIHEYRDKVSTLLATYTQGNKSYSFIPPKSVNNLESALSSVNPEDKNSLYQFYMTLTLPDQLPAHQDGVELLPWASATFDHAPIVAAASLLNSMKLDIKNAESMAADYLLSKVNAPAFDFNKIEPMAFAPSSYINTGDSLSLNVMVAAYDSNAVTKIRYGIDEDTLVERWKETTGKLSLNSKVAGQHRVKGAIGVRERGETVWRPWDFNYTVGQPMGVVALPKMRILYKKYDNEVEGTASGFPSERVSLSGSGCTLRREGGKWFATPNRGIRTASISVIGTNEDGSKTNLGSYDFEVRRRPSPSLYLGGIENGMTPGLPTVTVQRVASVRYDNSVTLTGISFSIIKGSVSVDGLQTKGKVLRGGRLDQDALRILRQSRGRTVTISVKYVDNKGESGNVPLQFKTR